MKDNEVEFHPDYAKAETLEGRVGFAVEAIKQHIAECNDRLDDFKIVAEHYPETPEFRTSVLLEKAFRDGLERALKHLGKHGALPPQTEMTK